MLETLPYFKIIINDKLYVKDPETSELGRKIIQQSVILIDEIGFEYFTFKKLGERIGSNESSLYRYFENKHKLLLYLASYYWGWIEYRLILATANINDANEKLNKAIAIVTEKVLDDKNTTHIEESILNRIIILEFTKTIQTKEVDNENKEGFFLIYKRVINRIAAIIEEVNPNYAFAKSLSSSIVEGALHQYFLKGHLKTITNCNETINPTDFYLNLVNSVVKQ
jgi:AcrR family transcriptional regulator